MARMMPATSSPRPTVTGPASSGIVPPRLPGDGLGDVVAEERDEDEDAPHAVDDAGDGGKQLDQERERRAQPQRHSSARKMAISTPSGPAISSAMADETTVP